MASAPPLPGELHKVVIVLSGSMLDAKTKRKLADYKKYMKAMRAVAKKHGARIVSKEIHLKQNVIDKRKKALRKEARRGGK
jgi:hypothetical protein